MKIEQKKTFSIFNFNKVHYHQVSKTVIKILNNSLGKYLNFCVFSFTKYQ